MPARPPRLVLNADTAADLMSENPISLRGDAPVGDAIALMARRGFSIAPVIDERGRPVGVISVTDLIIHERENALFPRAARAGAAPGSTAVLEDVATVADVMTPAVFSVRPTALVGEVVATMKSYGVHHLFVVDEASIVVGVISATDIVRHIG